MTRPHTAIKYPDKKINRFSTILEIVTNLGSIASWILGAGSAYVLNLQKFPVVIPGINFVLDSNFQFALVICGVLGYVHFLQDYWTKNNEILNLSESLVDFLFWDLPRFRRPLLLIPIVIIVVVVGQIAFGSITLTLIALIILILIIVGIVSRFRYNLSPWRNYEKLLDKWTDNTEWKERWEKRIQARLDKLGYVKAEDFQEIGLSATSERDRLEVMSALAYFFEKHEFDQNLIFQQTKNLPTVHPLHTIFSSDNDWVVTHNTNSEEL